MAGTGSYATAALFAVVMIMVGAATAADVSAPSPSPTMEAGSASMAVVPSVIAALMVSFIPFLASRL